MYKIVNNYFNSDFSLHFQLHLLGFITSSFLNIILDCKYVQIFILIGSLTIGTIYPQVQGLLIVLSLY